MSEVRAGEIVSRDDPDFWNAGEEDAGALALLDVVVPARVEMAWRQGENTVDVSATLRALGAYRRRESALIGAFARFLDTDIANGDATEDTVYTYLLGVCRWVRWCLANGIEPSTATRADIVGYRLHLRRLGRAPATRTRELSIVRRFYEAAVGAGLLASNPAKGVRGGRDIGLEEDRVRAFSASALDRLLEQVSGSVPQTGTFSLEGASASLWDRLTLKRDRAVIALMAVQGLRRVEVFRLRHGDLMPEEDASAFDGVRYSLRVQGKGHKVRRVALRPDVVRALREYERAKMEVGFDTSADFRFIVSHSRNNRGQGLSRQSFNDIVDKHLGSTGLKREGVSCHALRHTFGTLSLDGGAKLHALRDAMGHADLKTTGIYVKVLEKFKDNPAHFISPSIRFAEDEERAVTNRS